MGCESERADPGTAQSHQLGPLVTRWSRGPLVTNQQKENRALGAVFLGALDRSRTCGLPLRRENRRYLRA